MGCTLRNVIGHVLSASGMQSVSPAARVIGWLLLASSVIMLPTANADNSANATPVVSFRDEVLPLLSDRCFQCHGPDETSLEAELRLDLLETATADRGGYRAITPGNADESELIARIDGREPDLIMPPPESGKQPLTNAEVDIIRRWIVSGAKWEKHWSFTEVERPKLPLISDEKWPQNAIDHFVLSELDEQNLEPSPPAESVALLRRASLALTGLPPSEQQLAEFLGDTKPRAYERAVDRLLASPHYGERMAYVWLDAARYADTDGYQLDKTRENWPWRDWVVAAYNRNLSFDRFTIEQFAGDLLPNATADQLIATCFHRNHLTNGEGGRDPEESRVDYVLDRVNTIGTVWLGLTLGCCQCHNHKYDPITQREYYGLTAFFNSIDEDGKAGREARPYFSYSLPIGSSYHEQQLAPLRSKLQEATSRRRQIAASAGDRFPAWLDEQASAVASTLTTSVDWKTLKIIERRSSVPDLELIQQDDGSVLVGKQADPDNVNFTVVGECNVENVAAVRLEALAHPQNTVGGVGRSHSSNFVLTSVEIRIREPGKRDSLPLQIESAEADYEQPGYVASHVLDGRTDTGWAVWSGELTRSRTLLLKPAKPARLRPGAKLVVRLKHESAHAKHYLGCFRLSVTDAPQPRLDIYASRPLSLLRGIEAVDQLAQADRAELFDFFLTYDGKAGVARAQESLAERELEAESKQPPSVDVMVLRERDTPRATHVLLRGQWDQHGDAVEPNVPRALGELPVGEEPGRLALAKWLVNRNHPLTARVAVNRYWQQYFGAGLVRSMDDFGLQGERPTHPELLDWLAAEFMESGWDVKAMHRLIVTSATFRQSSRWRSELMERDPANRLLARGPRFRMSAALIRDQALAASGLLNHSIGGPPVFPYQPPGLWREITQGRFEYTPSQGSDLYRRSLYGFWRRNAVPPAMFDAADRRTCRIGVMRANSPMHALTLCNDPTYVEAARALSQAALQRSNDNIDRAIAWAFRRALVRPASDYELQLLRHQFDSHLAEFSANPEAAEQLLSVGESTTDSELDRQLLAALTVTCNVVLNLDETLNLE